MAIITNRATLLTAIQDYLARDDLSTFAPNFLQNAENKVYRRINLRNEERELNVPIGGGVAPLPYRFKALKFAYIDATPVSLLQWRPIEDIYRKYPDRSSATTPCFIAREANHFRFGPEASDGTLKGVYYQKQRPLEATSETAADELVENAVASVAHFITQSITLTAATYTFSVYVKQGAGTDRHVSLQASSTNVSAKANFDIVVGRVALRNGDELEAAFCEDVGNGWFRCSISFAAEAASTALDIHMVVTTGLSLEDQAFSGNGASSLYLWGAQCELSPYPTELSPASGGGAVDDNYKNLLSASENFENAAWTVDDTTVNADVVAPPLEWASPTQNWYTTEAPEVLLYGALLEAEPFIMNDARIPVWKSLFDDAVASLLEEEGYSAQSRGALRVIPEARRWA